MMRNVPAQKGPVPRAAGPSPGSAATRAERSPDGVTEVISGAVVPVVPCEALFHQMVPCRLRHSQPE